MNKHAKKAWELYLKMDTTGESFTILQVIANSCYKIGSFYYAAKAFDVLVRLDGATEYWEGKKGACVGVFQQVIAQKEPTDSLWDIVKMLESSAQLGDKDKDKAAQATQAAQADSILKVIKNWAKDSNLKRK